MTLNNSAALESKDTTADGSLVAAKGLVQIYHRGVEELHARDGVDVEVRPGEFIWILGHSGAGKTTMLNLFGLMDRPTDGELTVAGHSISRNISEDKLDKIRRENIGFIFQQFYLMPTL